MHPIDYLVLGLLALLVVLAVRYAVRHRGRCGGGCAGCPHADGGRSPRKRDPGPK
ncbi:FeoB-associated Cys-rich membrane protein [uncultured Anaerotruncus sp.]|uniref:FeoB-associated Cys-rich membrane protein n=1 Tax=uncultured Anaerotruncus sp. TaxID=905011 RepID=UPI00258F6313|nr:FeoB-associated Cys-rich membrane protein [uncultured Anaerotruncus sp.]